MVLENAAFALTAAIGGFTAVLTTLIRCYYRVQMAKVKGSVIGDLALLSSAIGPVDPVGVLKELDRWGDRDSTEFRAPLRGDC
jgi:hypothetical protein